MTKWKCNKCGQKKKINKIIKIFCNKDNFLCKNCGIEEYEEYKYRNGIIDIDEQK